MFSGSDEFILRDISDNLTEIHRVTTFLLNMQ